MHRLMVRAAAEPRQIRVGISTGACDAPGPEGLPLVGSLLDLRRDALGFLLRAGRRYGDVVRFRIGPRVVYLLNHPDYVQHVLQTRSANYRRLGHRKARPLIGEGLLLNEGDSWQQRRRLMMPALHRQRVAAFGALMVDQTLSMLDRWGPSAARGEPLEIAQEMTSLTLDLICRTLFSAEVGSRTSAVREGVAVAQQHASDQLGSLGLFGRLPTPANRRFRRAVHELNAFVYDLIARRRLGETRGDDLLAMLLEARDDERGHRLTDQQVHDEVMGMLLAGHETTSGALTWIWYLLALHPESARRLRAELASVLGERTPTVGDLPSLPYLGMVVKESMRLFPPVWMVPRQALRADRVGGFDIPAGAWILVCPYTMHHHPEFWDDPEGFDPERFAPDRQASRPRNAYFPFGAGPRQCIGSAFATLEAQLILGTVAQRYRLELLPGQQVVPRPLVTLRPPYGVLMRPRPI